MTNHAFTVLALAVGMLAAAGCRSHLPLSDAHHDSGGPARLISRGQPGAALGRTIRDSLRDFGSPPSRVQGAALPTIYPSLTRRSKRWDDWASLGASAAILTFGVSAFASGDHARIENVGHIFKKNAVLVPLATGALHGDPVGMIQYGASASATSIITDLLKTGVAKRRPGGGDDTTSFPSGHTTAVFSSAAFLQSRYGSRVGVPAYLAAALTAASRVASGRHFLDDVVAGASIAMIFNWALVRPYRPRVAGARRRGQSPIWRYEFDVGVSRALENEVQAPVPDGSSMDLTSFGSAERRTPYTAATLEYRNPGSEHEFALRILPYDAQGLIVFADPRSAGGVTFPSGVETRVRYTSNEIRLRYRRTLRGRYPVRVKIGGQVSALHHRIDLSQPGLVARGGAVSWQLGPHAYLGYELCRGVEAWAELDALVHLHGYALGGQTGVRWKFHREWDVGLGVRYDQRSTRASTLNNEFSFIGGFISIGHTFR